MAAARTRPMSTTSSSRPIPRSRGSTAQHNRSWTCSTHLRQAAPIAEIGGAVSEQEKPPSVVRRTPFRRSATTLRVPPLGPSAVFVARDADHMNRVYEGQEPGFTYGREGNPNAELLAGKIAALEGAECGFITSSGMSAVAAIVLGLLKSGDHIVAGNQLYGRTMRLFSQELPRLGFSADLV